MAPPIAKSVGVESAFFQITDRMIQPLFTFPKLVTALFLALLMFWPIWMLEDPFVFFDTPACFNGGRIVWQTLSSMAGLSGGEAASISSASQPPLEDGNAKIVRSFTFSMMVFALYSGFGFWTVSFVQAFVIYFLLPYWSIRSKSVGRWPARCLSHLSHPCRGTVFF